MDTTTKNFDSIEKRLDTFLRPVNPEESFAANLKNRLLIEPDITIEKPEYLTVLVLIGSIFFVGTLVVWILYRIINRNSD